MDNVDTLESDLKAYVRTTTTELPPRVSRELSLYGRHYWCWESQGIRSIDVIFFHWDGLDRKKWMQNAEFTVSGGGDLFWRISYDVDARTFTNVSVNFDM